jgi:VanZ family protein
MLLWLAPNLTETAVARVQYGIRKTGHVAEYAILAMLLLRALRGAAGREPRKWSRRQAWGSFLLTVGYAVTDEWHQAMTAARYGSGWDVLLDAVGAATGLVLLWLSEKIRSRR